MWPQTCLYARKIMSYGEGSRNSFEEQNRYLSSQGMLTDDNSKNEKELTITSKKNLFLDVLMGWFS